MQKKEKKIRCHWQKIIAAYFDFCRQKFDENPSFDGSSPRDLGMIVDAIEKKAAEKKIEWTENVAVRSINIFLETSFQDSWLHENFLLSNLNRQKDKIFFKLKSIKNGNANSETNSTKHIGNYKTAGQDIFADRLRGRIEKKFNGNGTGDS